MWDRLYTNGHVASMDPNNSTAFGAIHDAALGIKDGRIIWIGKGADLLDKPDALAIWSRILTAHGSRRG